MSVFRTAGIALGTAVALLTMPAAARAQTSEWTATAGYDTFGFRDVSRSIRPVDASPVSWNGSGPSVGVGFVRRSRQRIHRVDVFHARNADFSYLSPLRSSVADAADRARYLSARYEYRRYPFRDLAVRGFDAGVGVEGGALRLVFDHGFGRDLAFSERRHGASLAGVVAARFSRWQALTLETYWTNGIALARRHRSHSVAPDITGLSGGGWTSDWVMSARVRVADAISLTIDHRRSKDIFYGDHIADQITRRSLVAGVTYDR